MAVWEPITETVSVAELFLVLPKEVTETFGNKRNLYFYPHLFASTTKQKFTLGNIT